MTEPAAITATFSDFKNVKTRSAMQLVFEVPIEHAEHVMRTLGYPQPGTEIHCGIAKLDMEKVEQNKPEKRKPDLTAQAAMCCNDPVFRRFLEEQRGGEVETPDEAAELVRAECGVSSRSEIGLWAEPSRRWRDLHAQFEAWKIA